MCETRETRCVASDEYSVMVDSILIHVAGGKEKVRYIFINAADFCEVLPRYEIVVVPGRLSEFRLGLRRGIGAVADEQGDGLGEALPEKLHDEIHRAAAFTL